MGREERSSATLAEDAEEVKEEVECEDIGEDVEAEVNNLAAEVDSLTAEADVAKPPELSHEEEVKKRSDQLLDDLFIYMCRERKRKDEEEAKNKIEADKEDDDPGSDREELEEGELEKADKSVKVLKKRGSEGRHIRDQT